MSDDLCFGLGLPDTDIEFKAALDGAIAGLGKMQAVTRISHENAWVLLFVRKQMELKESENSSSFQHGRLLQ